jgi:hypothetical protein
MDLRAATGSLLLVALTFSLACDRERSEAQSAPGPEAQAEPDEPEQEQQPHEADVRMPLADAPAPIAVVREEWPDGRELLVGYDLRDGSQAWTVALGGPDKVRYNRDMAFGGLFFTSIGDDVRVHDIRDGRILASRASFEQATPKLALFESLTNHVRHDGEAIYVDTTDGYTYRFDPTSKTATQAEQRQGQKFINTECRNKFEKISGRNVIVGRWGGIWGRGDPRVRLWLLRGGKDGESPPRALDKVALADGMLSFDLLEQLHAGTLSPTQTKALEGLEVSRSERDYLVPWVLTINKLVFPERACPESTPADFPWLVVHVDNLEKATPAKLTRLDYDGSERWTVELDYLLRELARDHKTENPMYLHDGDLVFEVTTNSAEAMTTLQRIDLDTGELMWRKQLAKRG